MEILRTRQEMVERVKKIRARGQTIGFVPTMGFLHQGHISLVETARKENDVVIVSIFVNPTQFEAGEDFENYPRDLENDQKILTDVADYLFYPDEKEIYFPEEVISFQLKDITSILCGISRPHHFAGVCLVLVKFFNIIQPQRVYCGQKDYQQTVVVKELLKSFFFPIQLVVCPTQRESDGLAMSSRNVHLTSSQRLKAPYLYQSLRLGLTLLQSGEVNHRLISQKMTNFLEQKGIVSIDYIDILDAVSLKKVLLPKHQSLVIALAVFFGKVRLIDNIIYQPHDPRK